MTFTHKEITTMAQAIFPPGVSTDIPPEKSPVEEVIDSIIKPVMDFIDGIEKVNDFVVAGKRIDCEH
jgi:hypothetical protein